MRAWHLLSALLALTLSTACRPTFDNVDEACHDRVQGRRHATHDAEELIHRVNCHRRVARIGRIRLAPELQELARRQANRGQLLDLNATLAGLEEQNYPIGQLSRLGIWNLLSPIQDVDDPADRIDHTFANPYFRQVLLQTAVRHVGVVWSSDMLSMVQAFDYPPSQRAMRPVVYPVDGQLDAPTTWTSPMDGLDGIPGGDVGFPITITVSGYEAQPFGTQDPMSVEIEDAVLEGPEGSLDIVVVEPRTTQVLLMFTSAVVPLAPLEPDTDYTLRARVRWSTGDREIDATFRTRPD
ncbi:MAG: hypothetical protein EA397_06715 [Deltaproteobacteria bacterium]|nr:MAG: hypothetical protein EA397_06715 [Deltaproteobacteria bacterium]